MTRPRLTYANVVSTLVVFVALVSGTAVAANQLAKDSVGAKQLKKNSVSAKKIKKNAVTRAKVQDGSVNGAKVADGSLSAADINPAETPYSYIAQRLRGSAQAPFTGGAVYPVATYTQPANEDNQYLAAISVNFSPSCAPPRSAEAYLMLDAPDPATVDPSSTISLGSVDDDGAGSVTKRLEFSPYPFLFSPMSRVASAVPVNHTFTALLTELDCASGSGASVVGSEVDVIGTK